VEPEELLTLWTVQVEVGQRVFMTLVYARDIWHAMQRARYWLARNRYHLSDAKFEEHPAGFSSGSNTFPGQIRWKKSRNGLM
jgi:hypothetical protein